METGFIPAGVVPGGNVLTSPPTAVVAPQASKVVRAPGLKRGKLEEAITDRIKLEQVLGLTVGSNAALDCDPNTELVAYPAGCTVVLYNARKNRQWHVINASRKSVTCVAFSTCGRYLATGECGHAPAVRVWDLHEGAAKGGVQVAEFASHAHAVSCVAFSTSSKYLVSIGSQHDMIVNVWEWRAGLKLASNKVSSRVKAVSFAEGGNYFVTVGFRHVKFWYLEYSRSAKYKEPVPLMGRSAILGELKDNDFCDVACGRGPSASESTYAITRGGLLCEFNSRRLLDKWVELRTTSANCMSVGLNLIFVGCADGIVRCFSPATLQFVTTLPRTHYLGVDVGLGLNISHMFSQPSKAKYPDAVALAYDEKSHKLTCVYNDHSLYVWDVRDIKRVGKSHSALYHSACIWGLDVLPSATTLAQIKSSGPEIPLANGISPMPLGSFVTCSSDDTVRVWNLNPTDVQTPTNETMYKGNIYSNELLKVIYMDPELTYLKDVDLTATSEKDKGKSYDDKTGVRCVRLSPDGRHIASGDRAGNIRVHCSGTARPLVTLEAHDAEVLCLEYSGGDNTRSPRLLASASRDRLIHVFNVDEGYSFMQTLDDHSSSITAVRFLNTGNALQMVSCGADKTILFRQLVGSPRQGLEFSRGSNASCRSTLYDMEVEAGGRHILAACQDRAVRVYAAPSARHTKTLRGTVADDGTLIKVALDSSGIYLATSCTDKVLSVYDYYSSECMATMSGHSEIVTGLKFTADCQRLISAGGDGCIFVWRVPHDMAVTMKARLAQQAIRQGRKVSHPNGISGLDSETDSHFGSPPRELAPFDDPSIKATAMPEVPDYTLRIGRLPSWAKKSLGDPALGVGGNMEPPLPPPSRSPHSPEPPARGKWANRVPRVPPYSAALERRLDSDGSKDSSLDSGTDTRNYTEKRREMSQTGIKQRVAIQRPLSMLLDLPYAKTPAPFNMGLPTRSQTLYDIPTSTQTNSTPPAVYPRKKLLKVTIVGAKANARLESVRTRHHTDDSSLGSFKYEDPESTEHDGDVEDISDGERTSSSDHNTSNRMTYYPGNNDEITPSEFTVNAMDVEELRQSQRRLKKNKISPIAPIPAERNIPEAKLRMNLPLVNITSGTSVSGSGQDSEEDEDEVSTPSGDNADRNPLSGSCESLDTLGRREKFLKSAYESLSGAELDSSGHGNTSISAQHHLGVSGNGSGTSAGLDPEAARRRRELSRRIEETRRQLESVGFRSALKSSQSSTDLSYIPEKDNVSRISTGANRQRPVSMAVPPQSRQYARQTVRAGNAESSQAMRRAISLSDLAVKPSPSPRTQQAPSKSSSGGASASVKSPVIRQQQRHQNASKFSNNTGNAITRSSSVGVLNQSDSESEPGSVGRSGNGGSRSTAGLMRPTISSLNKQTTNITTSGPRRRPGMQNAYSSVNLSTVGQEDSSSEAEGTTTVSSGAGLKPAVPPRPRAGDQPAIVKRTVGRSGSDRDLSLKAREVTARLTSGPARSRRESDNSNVARMPGDNLQRQSSLDGQLSSQMCSQLAEQLTRTAGKVVQLYRRLGREPGTPETLEDTDLDSRALISGLEAAILETQKVLRGAVRRGEPVQTRPKQNGRPGVGTGLLEPSSLSSDGEPLSLMMDGQEQATQRLEELVSKGVPTANGSLDQGSAMTVIEQYSDILLSMMQRNMVGGQSMANLSNQPQSLPPQSTIDLTQDADDS